VIIKGQLNEYKVTYEVYGYTTYAPIIKVKKWYGWKKVRVCSENTDRRIRVDNMYPEEIREWFTWAVKSYENYKEAWDKCQDKH